VQWTVVNEVRGWTLNLRNIYKEVSAIASMHLSLSIHYVQSFLLLLKLCLFVLDISFFCFLAMTMIMYSVYFQEICFKC